jgi:hypothetical protein
VNLEAIHKVVKFFWFEFLQVKLIGIISLDHESQATMAVLSVNTLFLQWCGIAQSVKPLDTGSMVQGSNPGKGDIFLHLSLPALVPT